MAIVRYLAVALTVCMSLAWSLAAPAAPTVIGFDFARLVFPPIIVPVNDGDIVNMLYADSNVSFGCFDGTVLGLNLCVHIIGQPGPGGTAYARASSNPASSPNVVNLSATGVPVFDERYGYLQASFVSPVANVSIDAMPVSPPEGTTVTVNRPFLQAFNSQGQFLGTANYNYGSCNPNTTQCPWQTLSINRLQNDIKFVAFSSYSSSGGIMYGQFDNLAFSLLDSDGDGIENNVDNCTQVANPSQLDADGDGYGNICDGDLNNSGLTTTTDFNLLRGVLNQSSGSSALAAAADMNGSGLVTTTDFGLLRNQLNLPPGPSGYHPNCPPICP